MRIKRVAALITLCLLFATLAISMTVFAAPVEGESAPSAVAPAVVETTAAASAVEPVAQPTDPPAVKPAAVPVPEPTETPDPTLSPNAITPDGQGSVLNYYKSESDEKQFYTITTPAGNVFYLVVDGARGYENVYFLNAVTEADLMALAAENDKINLGSGSSSQTCICTDKCEKGKANADCPVCKSDISKCVGGSKPSTSDEAIGSGGGSPKGGDNNMLMYIIIGVGFVVVAGVGVYVKIIRPKNQQPSYDDEDESDDYCSDQYGSPEYLPEDDTSLDE